MGGSTTAADTYIRSVSRPRMWTHREDRTTSDYRDPVRPFLEGSKEDSPEYEFFDDGRQHDCGHYKSDLQQTGSVSAAHRLGNLLRWSSVGEQQFIQGEEEEGDDQLEQETETDEPEITRLYLKSEVVVFLVMAENP